MRGGMQGDIPQPRKKRGRPRTGRDPTVSVRLPPAVIREIDRIAHDRGVSRSQAARELLLIALLGASRSDSNAPG